MKIKKRYWIIGIMIIVVAAGFVTWKLVKNGKSSGLYRLGKLEKGKVVQTVRATGTIQPIKLVQVGTQVNGPVRKLYVDFNDKVKEGDLVAQIDPTVYEAQLARDEANLKQSLASVEQTTARLKQADNELKRSKELAAREMLSLTELDAATADRDSLAAQLKVALAAVDQTKAALNLSKANLGYTTIKSPVDGVVIARNVDEGQTVVASMSAQVLYTVAADLKHIQVVASIPEADIGKIQAGQPVTFTVDAYDGDFKGVVSQVRLAAVTVQNVVTYPVVVVADNDDGKLFPSMTANITCEVARRTGVLKVPNGALRFRPASDLQKTRTKGEEGVRSGGSKIWIEGGGKKNEAKSVVVKTGITDGSFTEVVDPGELKDGQDVIVGFADTSAASANNVNNPFTPKMPGRGGAQGR